MSVQNITLFRIKRKGISVSVLAPTFLFIGKSISIRPDTSRTNISWHLYFILLAYALWYLHCRIHLWPSLPSPDCRPFTSGQLSSGGCTGDWVRNEQEQKYHEPGFGSHWPKTWPSLLKSKSTMLELWWSWWAMAVTACLNKYVRTSMREMWSHTAGALKCRGAHGLQFRGLCLMQATNLGPDVRLRWAT